MTLRDIVSQVEKLSRDEQIDLLDELYCMLHTDRDGAVLTKAQSDDLFQRIEEYRAGKAKIIPGDIAVEQLRKRMNAGLRAK